MSIRVLVVDDHEITRIGLASMFENTDIKVVAEADTGPEGVKMASKHNPDVVLLDIRLPGMDGFDTLEKILASSPRSRVVMISAYDNPTYVARAVVGG